MCTGVELALLGGMMAVSTYSTISAANQAADAQVAQGRAVAVQAGQEQDAAAAQADRIRRAARKQASEANAALSASGVSVAEGTPIKIAQEIYRGGEMDALSVILGSDRQAAVADREAAAYGAKAKATRRAGQTQAAMSALQMGASAMTGSGWRSAGPGFSGTQTPAPITDRSIRIN